MTKKVYFFILLLASSLFSMEIPTKHADKRAFGKSIQLNSQVIQLSNAGQSVTSLVRGHLEKYYVEPGQKIKTGQRIALIESILVSKMTANFIALKKQYFALENNYLASKKLYKNGMVSMQEVNNQSIQKDAILADINSLKSQLKTLNIDADKLKKTTPNFTLYAHSDGRVSELLQALHTVILVDEAIVTIVKEQAFYIKSFVPLAFASDVKIGQKMTVNYNKRNIITHVTQVLPSVDEKTQRIVILSSVDEKADDLFINSYVQSTLYFSSKKEYVAVEKSALSFFNNEWVVFIATDEEHESPYETRVVVIVASDEKFVGINGLEVGEEYVSDKSYYVKSMMLKSSLGEHGH